MILHPQITQALIVRKAIQFYRKTGLKVNTAYTPKNMRLTAGRIVGQTPKNLAHAEQLLTLWLEARS